MSRDKFVVKYESYNYLSYSLETRMLFSLYLNIIKLNTKRRLQLQMFDKF